jgi:hypothetical protein
MKLVDVKATVEELIRCTVPGLYLHQFSESLCKCGVPAAAVAEDAAQLDVVLVFLEPQAVSYNLPQQLYLVKHIV